MWQNVRTAARVCDTHAGRSPQPGPQSAKASPLRCLPYRGSLIYHKPDPLELQQMARLMKAVSTGGNILRIKWRAEEPRMLNEHCQVHTLDPMVTMICEIILKLKNTFSITNSIYNHICPSAKKLPRF